MADKEPAVLVTPLLFGQEWTDPNGAVTVAEHDTVLLQLLQGGHPVAALQQTPESAIALARLIVQAAGRIQALQVGDDGQRPGVAARLAAFNDAWKQS